MTGWKLLVPERDRAEHDILGKLLGLQFDHQHALAGAGDDKIELRARQLVEGRVQYIFAVDVADAATADRAHERDAGQRQRRRAADHRHDVRVVLEIVAQNGADDLRLIEETRHEKRPDRPVDQPRYQRFLFRGPSLALEKTAGNLAGGERLFLVIDRQRKKILAGLRRFRGHGGAKDGRFAISRQHRAIGLPSNLAGLEHETAAAPHQFLTKYLEHPLFSFQTDRRRDRQIPRAVRWRAVPPPRRSLPRDTHRIWRLSRRPQCTGQRLAMWPPASAGTCDSASADIRMPVLAGSLLRRVGVNRI